jgi:hypothetical protein
MDQAEFARRMAETTQILVQVQQQLAQSALSGEDIQAFAAQTRRLARRLLAFGCVLLGASLLLLGTIIWQELAHGQAHVAQTRALLELVQRGQP